VITSLTRIHYYYSHH